MTTNNMHFVYCKYVILKEIEKDNPGKNPEELFEEIITWCKKNCTNTLWSHNKISRARSIESYGLKRICERELRKAGIMRYVANNWLKLALIAAGLDVTAFNNVSRDNRLTYRPVIRPEILNNSVNFIWRVKPES